jgi:hypothetical protein
MHEWNEVTVRETLIMDMGPTTPIARDTFLAIAPAL